MQQKRILAFGNPVYDLISTPFLQKSTRVLSGCSTNASLVVAKLGEQAYLVGTIGPDYAERLKFELDTWNINYHLFPSKQTGGFNLVYDNRGNRELSILGIADPIPAFSDGYDNVDFILLGPILGEVSVDLLNIIRQKTLAPVLLDPQGLLRVLRSGEIVHELTEEFVKLAPLATIIKANELEAKIITGINPRNNPEGAVRSLHGFGCKTAIITLAEAGSVIHDGNQIYYIPPYTTTAIDPTGAGDTYAAGFMVRYLETNDLVAVGCFASAVASIMVENIGPDFPLTRMEVERRAKILLSDLLQLKL